MSTVIEDVLVSTSGGDDDARLASIFLRSRDTLEFFQAYADKLFPSEIVGDETIASMRAAWLEIRPLFVHLLTSANWTPQERDALRAAGLTGVQLEYKYRVFDLLHSQFVASKPAMLRTERVQPKGKRKLFGKLFAKEEKVRSPWWDIFGWSRQLLKNINSILGSAAKAFPPAEIIKEFKEATESLLETRDRVVEELNKP